MNLVKAISLVFLVGFLNGCSFLKTDFSGASFSGGPQPFVYLSQTVQWQLPEQDVFPQPFTVLQQVHARYGEQSFDLLFRVEKQKTGRLLMVALTPSGYSLVQLNYHNGVLEGEVSPLMGDKIRLPFMVSDFLLTYAPADTLKSPLLDAGVQITDSAQQRSLFDSDGKLMVSVNYRNRNQNGWPKVARYQNHMLGYELDIQTLQGEFE